MRLLTFSILCLAWALPPQAAAADLRAGEVLSLNDAITDDVYVVGGQVDIDASVRGDVVGAGAEVQVNGEVSQDLSLAGGRISVGGDIGDDARIAGGEIRISGIVEDDLVITGGRVELLETADIGGDVRIMGGEVFIDGVIAGDLDIRAGRVVLRGEVHGNVEVSTAELTVLAAIRGESTLVAHELHLGSSARFSGDVTYWSESPEVDFTPVLDGAGATMDPALQPVRERSSDAVGAAAFLAVLSGIVTSLFFSLAFIVLAIVMTNSTFTEAAKRLEQRPWSSALTGFLYFCCTPIVLLILTITIVGVPLAILGGVLYGFTLYFAVPLSAILLAKLLEIRLRKHFGKWLLFAISVGMFLLLCLIAALPLFGWFSIIVICWFCCGALLQVKWKKLQELR